MARIVVENHVVNVRVRAHVSAVIGNVRVELGVEQRCVGAQEAHVRAGVQRSHGQRRTWFRRSTRSSVKTGTTWSHGTISELSPISNAFVTPSLTMFNRAVYYYHSSASNINFVLLLPPYFDTKFTTIFATSCILDKRAGSGRRVLTPHRS